MTDQIDLPLFGEIPAVEPTSPGKRRAGRRNLASELARAHPEPRPPSVAGSATLLPFPPSRDTRLVSDLAQSFSDLRQRHGRRCRAMLLDKRFRPIANRWRKLGVAPAMIEQELERLETAVARLVWRRDGCPCIGSGGGSAA